MAINKDELIQLEDEMVLALKGRVDTAVITIMNGRMTRDEALNLVLEVRSFALGLFPDKAEVFDLVYGARFKRVIDEYTRKSV